MSTRAQEKEPASFFVVVACEEKQHLDGHCTDNPPLPRFIVRRRKPVHPLILFLVLRIEDRDNLSIILV